MQRSPRTTGDDGTWDLDRVTDSKAPTSQWGVVGPNTYKGFPATQVELPAGAYSITLDRNDDRAVFFRKTVKTDDIIDLEDSITAGMLREIEVFWNKLDKFKKMGFLHRRGYLLYGPQGTGKSSVVKQVMADVVSKGGLVFLCDNPKFLNQALITLRQTEPERQLVCVFEDVDALIGKYGEDELLSLLDGANMVSNVLNIATTNYPERLDRRIISRPRRFDRVIKVDIPVASLRLEFFKAELPKASATTIAKLVANTEGLSMAALSEVLISVYCLGNSMKETIAILNRLEDDDPSSSEFGRGEDIGFDDKEVSSND